MSLDTHGVVSHHFSTSSGSSSDDWTNDTTTRSTSTSKMRKISPSKTKVIKKIDEEMIKVSGIIQQVKQGHMKNRDIERAVNENYQAEYIIGSDEAGKCQYC